MLGNNMLMNRLPCVELQLFNGPPQSHRHGGSSILENPNAGNPEPRHGTLHENLASAETLPRRQNDVPAKLNRDTFPLWAEEAAKTPLHNLGLKAKKVPHYYKVVCTSWKPNPKNQLQIQGPVSGFSKCPMDRESA